jgi:drug/metabolite transporter (DMT)-like permease
MLLPFGALVFGATLYSEEITLRALAGAALVAVGLLVAHLTPSGRPDAVPRSPEPSGRTP